METWYHYRNVWSQHPWMLVVALGSAILLLIGVVGTALASVYAVCFIPGLAAVFGHHLMAARLD